MSGGDTETVTDTVTDAVTDTVTSTVTTTSEDKLTETKTATETTTKTTTVVTKADGGVFTSTKVLTTTTTGTSYPAGSSSIPPTGGQSGRTNEPTTFCPNCSSKEFAIDVGVGVPLAAALLCSLILLFWSRSHNGNNQVQPAAATTTTQQPLGQFVPVGGYQATQHGYGGYGGGDGYVSPQEARASGMGSVSPSAELNARDVDRFELAGQTYQADRPPTYLSTK
jgi:hypothetical protein